MRSASACCWRPRRWRSRRRPKWGFLGVWFFAILAPSSSVVPLAGQTEAEHRMYLPLAAVVTLVVLAAYAALERLGRRSAKADAAGREGSCG